MGTTKLVDAFLALRDKLNAIEGLPQVGLNPVHPDLATTFPALFMAPDAERPEWGTAPRKMIFPSGTTASAVVLVYIRTADDHPVLEIMRRAHQVKSAVQELTSTEGLDVAYRIGRIDYDHSPKGVWHAAVVTVEFQDYRFYGG